MAKDSNVSQTGGGFSASGITRTTAGISGRSSRAVTPTYKNSSGDFQISKNVSIKNAQSPSGKASIRGGAGQVMGENMRTSAKTTSAEAKANARGLKAANGPAKAKAPAENVRERTAAKNVGNKIVKNYPDKPRKDSMSMGAQIVQKEGPSATRSAGKGPGSAQRYQLNSDALNQFPKSSNHQPRIGGHAN
jgi:hypothetical protein